MTSEELTGRCRGEDDIVLSDSEFASFLENLWHDVAHGVQQMAERRGYFHWWGKEVKVDLYSNRGTIAPL